MILYIFHIVSGERQYVPTDQLLITALEHFVLDSEHSASIAHIPKKNDTERPLNTLKYKNNNTSSGTQTVPLK